MTKYYLEVWDTDHKTPVYQNKRKSPAREKYKKERETKSGTESNNRCTVDANAIFDVLLRYKKQMASLD